MKLLRPTSLLLLAACAGSPTPAPTPEPPTRPTDATPPPPPPPPPAATAAATGMVQARLPNGLTAITLPLASNTGFCDLQLGLVAGSDNARAGLAELALEVVLANTDSASGRKSLRDTAAALGGAVTTELGPVSTWITLRVPAARWREGLAALHAAVAAPPPARAQVERIREQMLALRVRSLWRDPAMAATSFLLGFPGTAAHVDELLDRDPTEIGLFCTRWFRPDHAVLALRVPARIEEVAGAMATSFGAWQAMPVPAEREAPPRPRRLQEGLWWAKAPGTPCRALVLLPLPDAASLAPGPGLLMHALVTLDGIGGRLEQLLRQNDLGHVRWRAQPVRCAELAALVLVADITPDQAPRLWDAVRAARRSLRDLPPTTSELALARQRVPLSQSLATADAPSRLRAALTSALRGSTPAAVADEAMRQLHAKDFDVGKAVTDYLQQPAAMIVLGGEPPAGANALPFELLPPGAGESLTGTVPDAGNQGAEPWLQGAAEALGGLPTLARLIGYEGQCVRRAANAPPVEEAMTWASAGTLQRTRQLLGATIETAIEPQSWVERAGKTEAKLTPAEAGWRLRQAERHPLALLAAHATGQLRFRPVAQRKVDDRDLMILEATTDRFDRLRLWLDIESLLPRLVESWETEPEGSIVHVEEHWSDYRAVAGGLRAPFLCVATTNDGQTSHEAVWSRFTPRFAAK